MSTNEIPTVFNGFLQTSDPNHPVIEVGTSLWCKAIWNMKSFRYNPISEQPSFTARLEKSKYWYGCRKVKGELRRVYIGQWDQLTKEKLEEVAALLNEPQSTRQKKSPQQSSVTELAETNEVSQLWQAINELRQEVKALRNSSVLDAQEVTQKNIEPDEDELLSSENQVTQPEVIKLHKLVGLEEENKHLRGENEVLREKLAAISSQVGSGEIQSLRQQVVSLEQQNKELSQEVATTEELLLKEQNYSQYLEEKTMGDNFIRRCQAVQARVLEELKMGKQSVANKAINKFIDALKEDIDDNWEFGED